MDIQHRRIAATQGWLAIIANTALFGFKYWVGLITGSVAIIADAWHTLSDSLSSIMLLIGIRSASKPADEEHPFGHGRAEQVTAILMGALIAMVALRLGWESVDRLREPGEVVFGLWAIVACVATLLVKEGMAQYAFWGARKTKLASLKADAVHHRSDALSSLVLLIGILFAREYPWLDGVLGLIICAFLLKAAYDAIHGGANPLLGDAPTRKEVARLQALAAKAEPTLTGIHHVHVHRYGNHTEITFHVKVSPDMSVQDAHDAVDRLEKVIREEMGMEATIHMEPRRDSSRPG